MATKTFNFNDSEELNKIIDVIKFTQPNAKILITVKNTLIVTVPHLVTVTRRTRDEGTEVFLINSFASSLDEVVSEYFAGEKVSLFHGEFIRIATMFGDFEVNEFEKYPTEA